MAPCCADRILGLCILAARQCWGLPMISGSVFLKKTVWDVSHMNIWDYRALFLVFPI